MRKLWFFVEGNSEEALVESLMRNYFNNSFQQEKDISSFTKQDYDQNTFYCFNCQSVDKIPHAINEEFYKIKMSGSKEIFIICDIEKLNCNTKRKEKIESILKSEIDKSSIKYLFFNPCIEALYFSCPSILEKVIQKTHKQKFQNSEKINLEIPLVKKSYFYELQSLFNKHDVKYIESQFANSFFPAVKFDKCENHVIQRLIHLVAG